MLGIGAVLGGLSLGSLVKDILQTSAKTETLNVAMAAVANSTGTSLDILKDYKKSVMALGIAEQEATQIMTRFMQSQLRVADAAKVVRVAQDAGTIAGMNSSEAAEQMVEAIAKLQPRLLTAFGFTSSLNDIYGAYAKTVGKTTKQLSQVEKKQAMVNYILREGTKIAGSYEAAMGTFGKKLGSVEKLSLPKKLMQELKTSLGAPLILPGAGAVLDGLIQQLDTLRMWAVDNEATLRRWGQTVADAFSAAGKAVRVVTSAITSSWGAIKIAGTAILTYTALTKGATIATWAFGGAQKALKSILIVQSSVLQAARIGVLAYTLQMAAAPAATNIFTGALYSLRAALFAVHAALGPIGWAVLGVTAAVSGGMALWSKYSNSLNNINVTGGGVAKSAGAAAEAIGDQAEALGEAGKAAKKSLVGFDEINQLQKDMAGGGGALDDIDLGDIGEIGGGGGGLLDGLLDDIEIAKPTIKGFFEWMGDVWSDFVKGWGWVDSLSNWIVDTFYDAEQGIWSLKKAWDTWSTYVQNWRWVDNLSSWIVDTFYDAEQGVWTLKNAWKTWTEFVQGWGWVQGLTEWTVGVLESWEDFKGRAKEKWEEIKKNIQDRWEELKRGAPPAWEGIKNTIREKTEAIKKDGSKSWGTVKKTIIDAWEDARKKTKEKWDDTGTYLKDKWGGLEKTAEGKWEGIKGTISEKTEGTRKRLEELWERTGQESDTAWGKIKTTAETVWENIKTAITSPIENAKETLLRIIEDIKDAFAGMKIEIPTPKLPHVSISSASTSVGGVSVPYPKFDVDWYAKGGIFNAPSIIGVGEAGAEVVAPLDKLPGLIAQAIDRTSTSAAAGDVIVYVGNEKVDAYVQRSQDRRNIRSNGR